MKLSRIGLFISKKIVGAAVTVFLVMSILFFLLHSVPGGDLVTRTVPFATAEQKAQLRHLWGLDKPLYQQYIIYMKKVFTLDYSLLFNQDYDALDELLHLLPYTLLLFGTATVLSYLIGTFIGIRLLYQKSLGKKLISGASVVLYSIPAFLLAIYFKSWFTFKYQIFPPLSISRDFLTSGFLENMQTLLPGMVLPLVILVMVGLARPLFLMREQMSLVSEEPFVLTARAKGLTETKIHSNHVARCAILPLLNDASINLSLMISGGILIEFIFGWPGIGTQLFFALKILYYPTISAAIFLLTLILLITLIFVDVLIVYLDPRVVL